MNLILIRHAEAATAGPLGTDGDRPLTAAGEEAAARTGELLAGLTLPAPRVVCSPKLRAKQTADMVARAMKADDPLVLDLLGGGREPDAILSGLVQTAGTATWILVGHEPDMGRLLARLLDPAWGGTIPFATAGYAWVEVAAIPPPRAGRLRMFGDPRPA
jgi:phosphohistidine phosphatase